MAFEVVQQLSFQLANMKPKGHGYRKKASLLAVAYYNLAVEEESLKRFA